MRDDRCRGGSQHGGKCIDIGARQCCGGDWDVMIGKPVRLGHTPGFGSGELPSILAVGTVVDDRAYAGSGEGLDVRRVKTAGDAQSGGQRGKFGCLVRHAVPPRLLAAKCAACGSAVTGNWSSCKLW